MEGKHTFPSRDVGVFSGVTKIMWTSLLASLKLLLPKWRWWTGKCMTWNPGVIPPSLPLPSLPSAVFSRSLSPLVWSFCQSHQDDKQVQLHQPGTQRECKSSFGLDAQARTHGVGHKAMPSPFFAPQFLSKIRHLHHYRPFQKKKLELFVHDVKDMSINPFST